jgi:hypothetical protein
MRNAECGRIARFRAVRWTSRWLVRRQLTTLIFLVAVMAIQPAETNTGTHFDNHSELRTPHSAIPTVGMEGRVEITLSGTLLEARPVDPKSPMVLRIADTRPRGSLIYYDLRYIGLAPGTYDLRHYLVRADGSATNDLPAIPVEIAGLLPKAHRGELVAQPVRPVPFRGGYMVAFIAVATLWVLLFIPIWQASRRRKTTLPTPAAAPAPTLADRLRPLIEQAAHGNLSSDGQAQLERLLLSHWRRQLALDHLGMAEALVRLREHSQAGVLLRELENWLHRPPGTVAVDVEALLAPYRNLSAPEGNVLEPVK